MAYPSTSMIGAVTTFVTRWMIRVVVCLSLGGHVSLALLAWTRRRLGPGVGMDLLWLAYQVVDQAAPFFLSNLSLGITPHEQQLVELWVPFIVAHLAGPDNITGYSLDDNKLSSRLYITAPVQMGKIIWLFFKQFKVVTSRGTLFWTSLVMIAVGACKYAEKVWALLKADFGNIGSSSKKKKSQRLQIHVQVTQVHGRCRKVLGNEQALLLAHQLLDITKAAFADKFYLSKEELEHLNQDTIEVFFVDDGKGENRAGWKNMCRVVEMELSLMYDILYTKAAVIHNWRGFALRTVSLGVTATVAVLFWCTGSKYGGRRADVIITYFLMGATFLLDVRWLLAAAASSWTYTFFSSIPWLCHQVCCRGWWRRLRRFVESLDTWRLLPCLRMHGGGYRLWSGTMGQYNLFNESNQLDQFRCCGLWPWLDKKLKSIDAWKEYRCSSRLKLDESSNKDVKVLLFRQIQMAFKMDMMEGPKQMEEEMDKEEKKKKEEEEKEKEKKKKDEEKKKHSDAVAHHSHRNLDEELNFLPELQEAILIWHVATDVFLSCSSHAGQFCGNDEQWKNVKAIRAVADYMAFLAVVRPQMLPGLKLSSVHRATSKTLEELWGKAGGDRERLICMLKEMEKKIGPPTWTYDGKKRRTSALYYKSVVLSEGVRFGNLLSQKLTLSQKAWEKELQGDHQDEGHKINSMKRFEFLIPDLALPDYEGRLKMKDLLELLLKSWVRLLIYVSIRCGRDSHAKQLGRGCELTTFVWILSEHAGMFARGPRGEKY